MDLILDTHALIWLLLGNERIGERQRDLIENAANTIYLSPVSVYEIANKHRIGRMADAGPILKLAEENFAGFDWQHLPITVQHARLAGSLTSAHRDPFDRLLAAQALSQECVVMTVDAAIAELGAKTVW